MGDLGQTPVRVISERVGDAGTILVSTDGVNWTVVPSGTTANLNAVLFGLLGYGIVGAGGVNLSSY